jgi:hypothetical protein
LKLGITIEFLIRGMSRAYGGVLSALDVQYSLNRVEADPAAGGRRGAAYARTVKYKEQETIHAIYQTHRDLLATDSREIVLEH